MMRKTKFVSHATRVAIFAQVRRLIALSVKKAQAEFLFQINLINVLAKMDFLKIKKYAFSVIYPVLIV